MMLIDWFKNKISPKDTTSNKDINISPTDDLKLNFKCIDRHVQTLIFIDKELFGDKSLYLLFEILQPDSNVEDFPCMQKAKEALQQYLHDLNLPSIRWST